MSIVKKLLQGESMIKAIGDMLDNLELSQDEQHEKKVEAMKTKRGHATKQTKKKPHKKTVRPTKTATRKKSTASSRRKK